MIGTAHPNIFNLIEGLQKQQGETDHALARIEAGYDPTARRPAYVAHEKRILKIVKDFHQDVFDGHYLPYLKSIAHNMTL